MPFDAFEFQDKAVQDLAWVMYSPVLPAHADGLYAPGTVTDAWCHQTFEDNLPWLRALDRDPGALHGWLKQRRSRLLGLYFEALVEFWLRHLTQFDFKGAHIQVGQQPHTIGEFDFLFFDRVRHRIVHWETAVKFFLRYAENGGYAWLGPNPRDRLDRKLARMRDHQLRLGEREEARKLLVGALAINEPLLPEAYMKGYLFYPADGDWRHPEPLPDGVSRGHLTGWWTHAGDRLIPAESARSRWCVLERLQWLAPAYFPSRDAPYPLLDAATLNTLLDTHFATERAPLLLSEVRLNDQGHWREVSRGFIVSDRWPRRRH